MQQDNTNSTEETHAVKGKETDDWREELLKNTESEPDDTSKQAQGRTKQSLTRDKHLGGDQPEDNR